MAKLEINNLIVYVDNKKILDGVNLNINSGEVHVILGPNGVGKSSLCNAIMGNNKYTTSGSIKLDNEELTDYPINVRANKGLFLAYQNPIEFDGLVISEYLRTLLKDKNQSYIEFAMGLNKNLIKLGLDKDDAFRYLNYGFSGGQKKKLEVLQLKMLKPKFAFLDEIDSGLDVDALKIVSTNIVEEINNNNLGVLIITHYNKILDYIKPDYVHILLDGKIVLSGDYSLSEKIQKEGYEWLKNL